MKKVENRSLQDERNSSTIVQIQSRLTVITDLQEIAILWVVLNTRPQPLQIWMQNYGFN